jgi:uncharacterized membrane protein
MWRLHRSYAIKRSEERHSKPEQVGVRIRESFLASLIRVQAVGVISMVDMTTILTLAAERAMKVMDRLPGVFISHQQSMLRAKHALLATVG